ncbi:entericidin A/B family lipoprotein [Paraburkholderia pallida]|uniref:Entericidin A/B family lipoprotein n=1 Tax=Paraburkholderia pallida TaxID=2547399 RepID=A0A4P7CQ37_9BURK|nr:entericidin A/B family lipoprotein [Paraburkholderia pallida]QBQ97920.1 entericidin A/B family lipoprotein [Paraburkholderia pallida]
MKRLIALLLVTASVAALSACNTVAGAGEDLSSGGHAITNSAEQAK